MLVTEQAVRPSGIPSAAIMPIAVLQSVPAFLLGQASAGPRSSGKVARQQAGGFNDVTIIVIGAMNGP